MNKFHFHPKHVGGACTRTIRLWLLSFLGILPMAAADGPTTFASNDSTSPNRTGDWVQEGFDPGHTSFNRFETILSPENVGNLVKLWEAPAGGFSGSRPVVWHGKVYIGTDYPVCQMYALDAATGAILWIGPEQESFFNTSPAVLHRLVFANSFGSPFLAYNAETGEIAWDSGLPASRASPTLHGRTVYFCGTDNTLHALDAETGTEIWSHEADGSNIGQAPAVLDGRVFQVSNSSGSGLTAYDAKTGEILWNRSDGFADGGVAASHGMIFYRGGAIEGDGRSVFGVDAETGELIWETPSFDVFTSGVPAVAYGMVFVNVVDLVALDAKTGVEVWRRPLVHSTYGPSVANGVVYSADEQGKWDALDARDGTLLWSVNNTHTCCTEATPIVANGRLYLEDSSDRTLRVYGLPR